LRAIRTKIPDSLNCFNRTLTGQLQDSGFKPVPAAINMAKDKNRKDQSIASFNKEERENIWDDIYLKEEGIVIEFDFDSKTGRIRSLKDNDIYQIDSRELVRTKIELRRGDKVLFAPFENTDGNDYAKIIRIIELNLNIFSLPCL
jgi:hypothetical protein